MINNNILFYNILLADIYRCMISVDLSQTYKQHSCSILSFFDVIYQILSAYIIISSIIQTYHYRPIHFIFTVILLPIPPYIPAAVNVYIERDSKSVSHSTILYHDRPMHPPTWESDFET